MLRLALRLCDKCQNLLCWPISKFCSVFSFFKTYRFPVTHNLSSWAWGQRVGLSHSLFLRGVMPLASLRICTGSAEFSLLDSVNVP